MLYAEAMEITTLCYLRREGRYLLLYRDRKPDDLNAGFWIAPGGHLEDGESPLDCILREYREESGLTLLDPVLRGIVSFLFNGKETELTFLYTAEQAQGTLRACEEGELAWIDGSEIPGLSLWDGDRIFLPRLFSGNLDFFSLRLEYTGRELRSAVWEAGEDPDCPPFPRPADHTHHSI